MTNKNIVLEPQLRPEYIKELKEIQKGKYYEFKDMQEFEELIESEIPDKRKIAKKTKFRKIKGAKRK